MGPRSIKVTLLVLVVIAGMTVYFLCFRPVTTVVLIRHAEKKIEPANPDPDLSPEGHARAQELVRILGAAGISAIYVTQFHRTQQTAKPLADRLGLPLNQVESGNTAELVRQIKNKNAGGTVFVVGHNNTVPQAIAALGGGSFPTIPESEFDNMFIVTVYRFGRAKTVKLKYGNASTAGVGTRTMVP